MTTIAGQEIDLQALDIERVARDLEPEPIDVFFAVVGGRRFPPKQLVEAATGLDRADFNSHQARALLVRLGFAVGRRQAPTPAVAATAGPHGGAEAAELERHVGRWVAQAGQEIIFDASSPQEVARWLHRHRRQARVWRVPAAPSEVGSASTSAR